MSQDGEAGDLRVDRTDALLLQIQIDGNHGASPRSGDVEAGDRRGDPTPLLPCAGQAILHDLRQQRILETRVRAVQIGLDGRILRQVAEDLNIFDVDPLDELGATYGKLLTDPALHDLAVGVRGTLDRHDRWAKVIGSQLARAVAAHLLGTYTLLRPAPATVRGGLAPWQLRRAQNHIRADLGQALHLQEVAEACGLSVSHFARAFRQSTGVSPHAWLTGERILRAKAMMRRADLTLADIALACGFADQSHFTRVFAKDQGTSPGRWRRLVEPEAPRP